MGGGEVALREVHTDLPARRAAVLARISGPARFMFRVYKCVAFIASSSRTRRQNGFSGQQHDGTSLANQRSETNLADGSLTNRESCAARSSQSGRRSVSRASRGQPANRCAYIKVARRPDFFGTLPIFEVVSRVFFKGSFGMAVCPECCDLTRLVVFSSMNDFWSSDKTQLTIDTLRSILITKLARLLRRRTGFNSRLGDSRIFASRNRGGRCRWSAGFFGDLPIHPPLHSGAAPYSPRFTLIGSQDIDAMSDKISRKRYPWQDKITTCRGPALPGTQHINHFPRRVGVDSGRGNALRVKGFPAGTHPGMEWRWNARVWEVEYPEKTRRQAALSSTIPKCENPGMNPTRIKPGSPWWEASALVTAPPLPQ
ncbi:hypothetical protein PR048_000909 [Dryococelus australis]|uniref:Uncharacterized protein n=1 Tax=Dryococelus australis TaxID=614101 RepID=A0ABQ9IFW4_9NEOP|nr:hypothetical protein PR048_000909 [Dryococelus australis]